MFAMNIHPLISFILLIFGVLQYYNPQAELNNANLNFNYPTLYHSLVNVCSTFYVDKAWMIGSTSRANCNEKGATLMSIWLNTAVKAGMGVFYYQVVMAWLLSPFTEVTNFMNAL